MSDGSVTTRESGGGSQPKVTPATQHILIVDDDAQLRSLLTRYLGEQGMASTALEDGAALDAYLADSPPPDLIILDLMMPGEDGLSIARRLKAEGDIPVIILSARGDEIDRIVGLEIGADDYLPKPFNPRELLARIRAVLRRPAGVPAETPQGEGFGPFAIDLSGMKLTRDGQVVPLTTGEFCLLRVFVENPRRVLSRDSLLDQLKGYDHAPFDRSIDVRVTRLRKKIEDDPSTPRYIRTIWGKGYIFDPDGAAAG